MNSTAPTNASSGATAAATTTDNNNNNTTTAAAAVTNNNNNNDDNNNNDSTNNNGNSNSIANNSSNNSNTSSGVVPEAVLDLEAGWSGVPRYKFPYGACKHVRCAQEDVFPASCWVASKFISYFVLVLVDTAIIVIALVTV